MTKRLLTSSRGQILVPSLMIFPALILFAILIVEVAKLSQQKILMQFAIDTSVFMEASQASDAANRFAYLNSPWVTRIFEDCNEIYNERRFLGGVPTPYWKFFEESGAFPSSVERNPEECISSDHDIEDPWHGNFRAVADGEDADILAKRNEINAKDIPDVDLGTLMLFKKEHIEGPAGVGRIDREDVTQFYQGVYTIYGTLYQIATMVKLVYEQLHGVFFKKTFWLNTGFNIKEDIITQKMHITEHYSSQVKLYYTIDDAVDVPRVYIADSSRGDIVMPHMGSLNGMWQLSTIQELRGEKYQMPFGKHYYDGPPNSFGVVYRDLFNGWDPYVTASAEIQGGSVWPNSKPTFQVRLRP